MSRKRYDKEQLEVHAEALIGKMEAPLQDSLDAIERIDYQLDKVEEILQTLNKVYNVLARIDPPHYRKPWGVSKYIVQANQGLVKAEKAITNFLSEVHG